MTKPENIHSNILFFDGYCVLCNGLVDWMIQKDKGETLKFASLQGSTAKKLLPNECQKEDPSTILYLRQNKIHNRSTAVLLSIYDLGGAWKSVGIFLLVPKFIRDLVYKLFARARFLIFGKRASCRLPLPKEQARILP